MLEVVVLGVAGVLQPIDALWAAEVDAACAWLAGNRRPVERLRQRIEELRAQVVVRRQHRERWALLATLRNLRLGLSAQEASDLFRTIRLAVPNPPDPHPGEALRALRAAHRLAFLDSGPALRMERWLARLGVTGLAERELWMDDLGDLARPPRPLAFRWLADRLQVRGRDCLYVAGAPPLGEAARSAGWRVWEGSSTDPSCAVDLDALVGALADGVPARG